MNLLQNVIIIAARYDDELSSLNIKIPLQNDFNYSAFHLYVIRADLKKLNKTHNEYIQIDM